MSEENKYQDHSTASDNEKEVYGKIVELFRRSPIPDTEVLKDLAVFLNRPSLAHILFIHDLYKQILDIHGSIVEFGVKWGRNMGLLTALRSLYEPHNMGRKIIGFDTFEGFPNVSEKDGTHEIVREGALAVTPGYESFLAELLSLQEQLAPRPHVKKHELVKGDAAKTFKPWLDEHPDAIFALAIFDVDLYEPTKVCLELLQERLTRGSIVLFDQLGWDVFPGEARAFQEVMGSRNYKVKRDPRMLYQAYVVVE